MRKHYKTKNYSRVRWHKPVVKRGRPKAKPSLRAQTNKLGWIQTRIADIYLPSCSLIQDRQDFKVSEWNSIKMALQDSKNYYDLTRRKYNRAIVVVNNLVFAV